MNRRGFLKVLGMSTVAVGGVSMGIPVRAIAAPVSAEEPAITMAGDSFSNYLGGDYDGDVLDFGLTKDLCHVSVRYPITNKNSVFKHDARAAINRKGIVYRK